MKKPLIICFLLALSVFTCKKDKIVINNPAYAVGTIVYWEHSPSHVSEIDFQYYGGGSSNIIGYDNGQYGWTIPNSGNYNKGDKYMVQYDPSNLNHARFLFDYPVTTPADSTNYVNQFKSHPPSCCLVYAYRLLGYK